MKLSKNVKFYDIALYLEGRFPSFKNIKNLRIFNAHGVELMEDDFEFVKNGVQLYVSKGEDFDQYSSFSEYEIIKELG